MGKSAGEAKRGSIAGALLSGLLFIGAPLAAFWGLAALLVSLGLSRWVAGPVAALVPVLPLVWHLVGERKRKKAESPKKGLLSGRDRLGLRMLVFAGATLGVMFGLFRDKSMHAVKHYADWPLHGPPARASGRLEPAKLLRWVPNTHEVAFIDVRVGGTAWARWMDSTLPARVRGLDYHSLIWTREVAVMFSDKDLVQQMEARAKADGKTLPTRGKGRYWVKKGYGAAFVTPGFLMWGSDISWIESVADGKQGAGNTRLHRAASRVEPGAFLVLLDGFGHWLRLPGITQTAIAMYREGSRIRIDASARANSLSRPHVFANISSLAARAFGTADRDGVATGKVPGLTMRIEDKMVYARLVRPAAEIEAIMARVRKTGSSDKLR
jgi:hypothetical protein